jgi:hypothetical protein
MPTATQAQPIAPDASIGLLDLPHINGHPHLKPLFAQQGELRAQLAAVGERVTLLRRELAALPQDASFASATARRTVSDQLSDLEREGARLEAALRPLARQIEETTEAVRAELAPLLTRESVAVFARLVTAMEQLSAAQAAYEVASRTNWSLLGSALLHRGALDATLPFRLDNCRQWLAKLQQSPGADAG